MTIFNHWRSRKAAVPILCLCLAGALFGCSGTNHSESGDATESAADMATENSLTSAAEDSPVSTTEDGSAASSQAGSRAAGNADTVSAGPATRDIFAMDTYMSVTAYGENAETAVDDAEQEIKRLDALLSTGSDTSAVGEINENGSGVLPEEGCYLLSRALEISEETDGAFDPAIYPMMELWGFPTEEYRVPTDEEITECMKLIDPSNINFDEDTGEVSFKVDGMALDFGGIAKGYTSSRVMDIFKEDGVQHGLANLGGNVQTLGTKPDGSNWRVGIQNPVDLDAVMGVLETHDTAVITSGGYERYFEEDGVQYHHIIDPSTGKPADSGLLSSTIVTDDGTLADGLSTSLFIMGKDKAADFWRRHSDEFDYILCDEDMNLYVTEGIADSFTSDYPITVVTKDGS